MASSKPLTNRGKFAAPVAVALAGLNQQGKYGLGGLISETNVCNLINHE
jgi:hypothetical protein